MTPERLEAIKKLAYELSWRVNTEFSIRQTANSRDQRAILALTSGTDELIEAYEEMQEKYEVAVASITHLTSKTTY